MVSTRSTVQKLFHFDPEPEQIVRRRRREKNLQWVPSLQETFLQSLFSEDMHSKETMAFVILEAGQPLGNSLTAHATNIPSCITYPEVEEGSRFEIKQHMLNILPTFRGFSTNDPNMHIAEFLMGCKNILVRGFSSESIKLRLFLYTLKDQARRWLLTLPSRSISTWNQLNEKFLSKYYPASKTLDMRTQILSFAQKPNEEFHEAWEQFKELIRKCPHSGINCTYQMHIFFRGLNMTTKTVVNASCKGSYKDKKAQEACLLFEKIAADTQQWAVKQPQSRSVFEMSNGSPYVSAQIEKMEKKLARFDAKFDMLLQRIPGSQVAQQDRSKNTAEATTKNAKRVYVPPMPYPERLKPKAKDQQLTDFMKTLAKVQINLPLIDAIENIPSYAKFLKDVCTKKKKLVDFEKVILAEQCSAVLLHKLPPKKKDPGSFTISCTIGNCDFSSALIDLGASVNLMPYSVFKRLGEGELKPISSIIQLADRSITYPRGVIEDVIVKVDNLYLPVDFMVLDMDEDLTTPIILARPFLARLLLMLKPEL
ncbi:uncharacterized protein [Pyrus communis]|uniref:uncharacterized protein n=1 Tax=Pyrus communis TaxID=23211 RepID=UPI0035C18725